MTIYYVLEKYKDAYNCYITYKAARICSSKNKHSFYQTLTLSYCPLNLTCTAHVNHIQIKITTTAHVNHMQIRITCTGHRNHMHNTWESHEKHKNIQSKTQTLQKLPTADHNDFHSEL